MEKNGVSEQTLRIFTYKHERISVRADNDEKRPQPLFVLSPFRCYTNEAVTETNATTAPQEPWTRAKAGEHLENYIVQETKNKPVILRQGCREVSKLRNEITQRIWVSVQSKWANESERTCQRLNSRVWSWLRTNAGGVPNTCKSNGDIISVIF